MTPLARFVAQKLKELDWSQNRLAHEWQERDGTGKHTTYETRLSKLMRGDVEGYKFIDGNGDGCARLVGLADALGCELERIRELAEVSRQYRTLILDPRLPERQRTFFMRRAALPDAMFETVELGFSGDEVNVRETIRIRGKGTLNPVVVLPDERDTDFFEGAGMLTSRVEAGPAGSWKLLKLPDLTPPPPERLHDDDGMPMVPMPELEARYRELKDRLASHIGVANPRDRLSRYGSRRA